jgi:uroporphyrinogen-III synthase
VTFTSSSTVRYLFESLAEEAPADRPGAPCDRPATLGDRRAALGAARLASIGPVTSATLREHGLEPDVEAERHDIDGLVAALVADAAARKVPAP